MGDRCLIQFYDGKDFSPVVYLHRHGEQANEFLDIHDKVMQDRKGDLNYSCARFIGICHEKIRPPLSLGIWNAHHIMTEEDSHGDAGVILVDVNTFERSYLGGYLGK